MADELSLRLPCKLEAARAAPARRIGFRSSADLDQAALRAWRETVAGDREASVYLHPDLLAWAATGKAAAVTVYTGRSDPTVREPFRSLGVLPAKQLRIPILPGVRWAMPLQGLRLLEERLVGDGGESALGEFVEELAGLLRAGEADFVLFQDLPGDAPLRKVLEGWRGAGASVWQPNPPMPHWWIRFPQPAEDYWKKFSKKSRYNFRWRAKRLEHTLRRIGRPEQVAEFVEKANGITRLSWQHQKLGMGLEGIYYQRGFWEQVASLGAMRSYLLEQKGKPVAFVLGIQWNGRFKYEETCYDPAYAEFSPGQVLLHRVLEDLIAEDCPRDFDFGYGHADYKEMFANHLSHSGPVILAARNWRATTGMVLDQVHRWMSRASRSALRRAGVLGVLRRTYRR